ncbi:MAG: hypothetical protein WDM88_08780 [Galbitalea sp.]
MDFLQTDGWIVWLVLILLFVIIEVVTVDFSSLMLAVGSVGGLISASCTRHSGFRSSSRRSLRCCFCFSSVAAETPAQPRR